MGTKVTVCICDLSVFNILRIPDLSSSRHHLMIILYNCIPEKLISQWFSSFWHSNILVETCWHLQFLRFVVGPFSYLFHVLYIEFDLLFPNNRGIGKTSWKAGGEYILPPTSPPQFRAAATSVWGALQYPQWVIIFVLRNKNCLENHLLFLVMAESFM